MRIAGIYSFKNGKEEVTQHYPKLLKEVKSMIEAVNAAACKNKESNEKTKAGKFLYSPKELNKLFKQEFKNKKWQINRRLTCKYSRQYYVPGYHKHRELKNAYREIDFIKEKLGVEIQFGKYSFMVYDVCSKMIQFQKQGLINCGIEIVPVKAFAEEMSSGVSYFEQFIWDLESRGVSDIDIPVMIIGIDA